MVVAAFIATEVVANIYLKKSSGLNRIRSHDLCDAGSEML